MVIVCPECTTKFRVNPERIPDQGAKVRCARCKHVFLAQKPAAEPEAVEPVVPPIAPPEPEPAQTLTEPEPVAEADSAQPSLEESLSETPADEGSFSYEQFHSLDNAEQDEDFSFTSDDGGPVTTEEGTTSEAVKSQTPEEILDFIFSDSDAATQTKAEEAEGSAAEVSLADVANEDEIPAETETVLEQTIPQKKSAFSSLIRLLLLLILGLLILGGVMIYMNGPETIQQSLQQLLGQTTQGSIKSGQVVLDQLEGKFINNQQAGELFIIRGEATNLYDDARAAIQVKGVIFDKDGKPLLQKTIFCGNPISDQELQTLPFNKLEEMMGNQFGKSLSNMKVASKQMIPFVIAFRDLPKTLSEFSVDVTSSEAAAN